MRRSEEQPFCPSAAFAAWLPFLRAFEVSS